MQRLSQSGSKLESRALGENPPVCSLYNDDDDDDGDDDDDDDVYDDADDVFTSQLTSSLAEWKKSERKLFTLTRQS